MDLLTPARQHPVRTFLLALATRHQLVELCQEKRVPRYGSKSELASRVLKAYLPKELLDKLLTGESLEWWAVSFLKALMDGCSTKDEILDHKLVRRVLETISADKSTPSYYKDGLPERFVRWNRRFLAKRGMVSLGRRHGKWTYTVLAPFQDHFRLLVQRVSPEQVLERYQSSPLYLHFQQPARFRGFGILQSRNTLVGAQPPSFADEDAQIKKVIAFSDYRVQDIDLLIDFIKKVNPPPDLLLYGGDDVDRFGRLPDDYLRGSLLKAKDTPVGEVREVGPDLYSFRLQASFQDRDSMLTEITKQIVSQRTIAGKLQDNLVRALKESKNEREIVGVAVQTLQEHGCAVKRVSPTVPTFRKEPSTLYRLHLEIEAEGFKTLVSLSKGPDEEPSCFVHSDWPVFVPKELSSSNPIDGARIREFLATRCAMLFEANLQSETVVGVIHVVNQQRNLFEELASLSKYGLCAVIGNDDHPAVRAIIHGKGVYNVHERPVILGDYAVIGMEGACIKPGEPNPGLVLYNEDEVSAHLNSFWEHVSDKRLIIISHNPPFETLDHALRFGERDIGSETLRRFIQENKTVSLVISGHVHYCGGKSANLGNAVVVNAASHDHQGDPGRVAIIDLSSNGLATVEWHILHELSEIFGVGERTAYKFQNAGIRKPEDLVAANFESVSNKTGLSVRTLRGLALRARAIVEDRVYRLGSFTPPSHPRIYLDIETDLTQTLVWLVGVHSDARDASACFFANSPDEEKEILLSLLDFVGKEPDATICSFSGSNFDRRVLQKRLQAHQLPTDLSDRIVDLCPLIRRSVALPLKSYKLKSLAGHFGYQYKHRTIDGWDVAMMYLDYLRNKDTSLRQTFEEYNHDDVMSLPHLIESISALTQGA